MRPSATHGLHGATIPLLLLLIPFFSGPPLSAVIPPDSQLITLRCFPRGAGFGWASIQQGAFIPHPDGPYVVPPDRILVVQQSSATVENARQMTMGWCVTVNDPSGQEIHFLYHTTPLPQWDEDRRVYRVTDQTQVEPGLVLPPGAQVHLPHVMPLSATLRCVELTGYLAPARQPSPQPAAPVPQPPEAPAPQPPAAQVPGPQARALPPGSHRPLQADSRAGAEKEGTLPGHRGNHSVSGLPSA